MSVELINIAVTCIKQLQIVLGTQSVTLLALVFPSFKTTNSSRFRILIVMQKACDMTPAWKDIIIWQRTVKYDKYVQTCRKSKSL